MMLNFKQEVITPEKAAQLLKHTVATGFVNRGLSKSAVDRYARDMTSGNWRADTGEVIKIDTEGAVIDGQNRLSAVVQSKKTIDMWVCRGMEREVFQFLDQGKPRDLQNLMQIEMYPDPRVLAVTGKMLWRFEKTLEREGQGNPYAHAGSFNESEGAVFNWIKGTRPDLRRTWDSHKAIIKKAYSGCNRNIAESLLFFCMYQWLIENAIGAVEVMNYFANKTEGVAAPHPAVHWAAQYADDLKAATKLDGVGATSGRHGDAKECLWLVLEEMWRIYRDPKENAAWKKRKYSAFKRHCVNELNVFKV